MKIDKDIETARREVMVARNAAYSRQQWAEVDRLTQILKTFPIKTSNGTYQSCAS